MCGIAGFCSFNVNFREESSRWYGVLQKMNKCQKHRGPDNDGLFLDRNCGLAHTRLSILDLSLGSQPMTRQLGNRRATIVYNGEIYNMPALRKELERDGIV
ncbi:MAG: asparagine synthetase B, partial [Lachnospiraceae bacterium]|nr:asparagine synthetase B [Lachnospiraceae bacterium]